LTPSDTAVVLALSGSSVTFVYVENDLPFFAPIQQSFSPTDLYETSKDELLTVLVPSLPALFRLFSGQSDPLDVLEPLRIIIRESSERPFAAFFFLATAVSPFTAERAAAASRAVASNGGVVHFGAAEHFKRLSAVAQSNFGLVFGLADRSLSLPRKLIAASQPIAVKVYCPRFVELQKVTSGDGSVRSTAHMTLVKLKGLRGCSGRLAVDHGRIAGHPRVVRILEVTRNVTGRYIKLHSFEIGGSAGRDEGVTGSLVLKGLASDMLRAAWQGGEWPKIVAQFFKGELVERYASKSCIADLGGRADRDALRLFYVLECFGTELANRLVPVQDGFLFIAPPVVYAFGDAAIAAVDEVVLSEWPFELRIFTNLPAFRLVIEKLGGHLD
jgi:hypothetical protein